MSICVSYGLPSNTSGAEDIKTFIKIRSLHTEYGRDVRWQGKGESKCKQRHSGHSYLYILYIFSQVPPLHPSPAEFLLMHVQLIN